MESQLLNFILTVAGGAIGAYLAATFALKQFKTQRWWDKKLETYLSVIEAFQPVLDEEDAYWTSMVTNKELSEERKQELRKFARTAEQEIKRRGRLGALLISAEAAKVLEKMDEELARSTMMTSWSDHRLMQQNALWTGYNEFKAAAANDLGISPTRVTFLRFRVKRDADSN